MTNRERFGHKYDDPGYPFLWITFYQGDKDTAPPTLGLLDSGSDRIMIPRGTAEFLGLKLKPNPTPFGTAGGPQHGYDAIVDKIRIGRTTVAEFFNVEISVTDNNIPILIGLRPFFNEYVVILNHHEKNLECIRQDIFNQKKNKKK